MRLRPTVIYKIYLGGYIFLCGIDSITNHWCTHSIHTADSRPASSQRETSLQSNAASNWLGANLESALLQHANWGTTCNLNSNGQTNDSHREDAYSASYFVKYSITYVQIFFNISVCVIHCVLFMATFIFCFNQKCQNAHGVNTDLVYKWDINVNI